MADSDVHRGARPRPLRRPIPQKHAAAINRFHEEALNPYLNFRRPCYFAVDTMDARGRIRKTYPTEQIMAPWDRLRSIPHFEQYLKPGIMAQALSETAMVMTDSQAAPQLQDMRRNLFASLRRQRTSGVAGGCGINWGTGVAHRRAGRGQRPLSDRDTAPP